MSALNVGKDTVMFAAIKSTRIINLSLLDSVKNKITEVIIPTQLCRQIAIKTQDFNRQ